MKRIPSEAKFKISFASSSCFDTRRLLEGLPELWQTNQEFPVDIIPPWYSMLIITWGINNRPPGGHSSEM
jgi:hypothetical protein